MNIAFDVPAHAHAFVQISTPFLQTSPKEILSNTQQYEQEYHSAKYTHLQSFETLNSTM